MTLSSLDPVIDAHTSDVVPALMSREWFGSVYNIRLGVERASLALEKMRIIAVRSVGMENIMAQCGRWELGSVLGKMKTAKSSKKEQTPNYEDISIVDFL